MNELKPSKTNMVKWFLYLLNYLDVKLELKVDVRVNDKTWDCWLSNVEEAEKAKHLKSIKQYMDAGKQFFIGMDKGDDNPEIVLSWFYKDSELTQLQIDQASEHLAEYTRDYFEQLKSEPRTTNKPD